MASRICARVVCGVGSGWGKDDEAMSVVVLVEVSGGVSVVSVVAVVAAAVGAGGASVPEEILVSPEATAAALAAAAALRRARRFDMAGAKNQPIQREKLRRAVVG